MASDLFDQLAELEVPPPPESEQFDRQLHERVNRSLVAGQLMDLAAGALPFALAHFSRALIGLLTYSVVGRYETKPPKPRR